MIMSVLQTIVEKGYINDVRGFEDDQLLWIELKSYELSSSESNTLFDISQNRTPNGTDEFVSLFRKGVVNEVKKASTGNWCVEIEKSLLSKTDLDELKKYTMNNTPVGNTEENRGRINRTGLPKTFQ